MRGWYVMLLLVALGIGVGAVYLVTTGESPAGSIARDTVPITNEKEPMRLTSSVFQQGDAIPSRFTCDGENISPPILWSEVPTEAKSLALVMDDPDIPQVFKDQRGIDSFDHWTLFNIPPTVRDIPEGGTVGVLGTNGAGKNAYTGPCPPKEYEPSEHRYFFRLYALDSELTLQEGASKRDVLAAIQGHIIEEAQLTGRYKKR